MKSILTSALLALSLSLFAQAEQIILTEDMVITETMVISADTEIVGNGYAISCANCSPAIHVKNGATVEFLDVMFPRNYSSWLRISGNANVTWESPRMKGHITRSNGDD